MDLASLLAFLAPCRSLRLETLSALERLAESLSSLPLCLEVGKRLGQPVRH